MLDISAKKKIKKILNLNFPISVTAFVQVTTIIHLDWKQRSPNWYLPCFTLCSNAFPTLLRGVIFVKIKPIILPAQNPTTHSSWLTTTPQTSSPAILLVPSVLNWAFGSLISQRSQSHSSLRLLDWLSLCLGYFPLGLLAWLLPYLMKISNQMSLPQK